MLVKILVTYTGSVCHTSNEDMPPAYSSQFSTANIRHIEISLVPCNVTLAITFINKYSQLQNAHKYILVPYGTAVDSFILISQSCVTRIV